ncbi:mitochondrial fission ELM1 family protein [Asaia prunellae]|uniref:mitochondrial fission ELM1 family protein n=1 Tax=Asaia prunellae TaxID=610245 RepID=UPI00047169CC|nr:mitochondrial fission ELM1 family protein [Asaia prunellae]
MSVAIIAEDFAGMRAQASGLVERAGLDWHFHPVRIEGVWRRIPTRFCPDPLRATSPIMLPSGTDMLVSVGGTGGAVAAALRKKTGLRLVQIQNPRMAADRFDLIIANVHDFISGDNIISLRTALHGVTRSKLDLARMQWQARLSVPGKALLSVLIGGANGRFSFGVREAEILAAQLIAIMNNAPVSVAMTPSRRTDPGALQTLKDRLASCPVRIWDGEGENPYHGLLACADAIAVTTDSVSMISEASATDVPVMIIDLPGRSRRISAFVAALAQADRVRPFRGEWAPWPVTALDDTGRGQMR